VGGNLGFKSSNGGAGDVEFCLDCFLAPACRCTFIVCIGTVTLGLRQPFLQLADQSAEPINFDLKLFGFCRFGRWCIDGYVYKKIW
jgi:uncharacterized membrane protein YiaA